MNQDTGFPSVPLVHGNYIVWEDLRNGDRNIYSLKISTKEEFKVNQDTGNSSQLNPAIHGDFIVWEDYRNGDRNIYAYQISLAEEFNVTQGTGYPEAPSVYGDYIVWQDNRNEIFTDIYLYTIPIDTEKFISQGKPALLDLPSTINQYSAIIFGDELDFYGFALSVFDAADVNGVNMLGIGTNVSLGYLLFSGGRFGLSSMMGWKDSDMEINVTSQGQGNPIFNGLDTSAALIIEEFSGNDPIYEQTCFIDPSDPNSPSDWTILADFRPDRIFAGQCAIAEFTTSKGNTVILDGSANSFNGYDHWTQARWDLLYNELIYLLGK